MVFSYKKYSNKYYNAVSLNDTFLLFSVIFHQHISPEKEQENNYVRARSNFNKMSYKVYIQINIQSIVKYKVTALKLNDSIQYLTKHNMHKRYNRCSKVCIDETFVFCVDVVDWLSFRSFFSISTNEYIYIMQLYNTWRMIEKFQYYNGSFYKSEISYQS